MNKVFWMAVVVVGLVLPGQAQDKPAEKKLTRVLIVTGRDVPAHNWREVTPVLREQLEKTGEFEVLGGSVTKAGPLLFEPMRESIRQHVFADAAVLR